MKTMLSPRRHRYLARFSTLLVAVALIAGTVGCSPSAAPQYELAISSTEGGSVTTPGEGTFVYDEGTVVNLLAEAEEGHRFVNWTGDVGAVADTDAASTTITTNGNYSITASFEAIAPTQYSLNISSTAGGTVTTPGEGMFTYDAGTVVNLVATLASGYRFVNWTGNVGTVANVNAASTTITMNGDYSVTASFVAVYDLTISSTAGGSVATPGEGTFTYEEGEVVSLVAAAGEGYHFINWTGNVGTIADVGSASAAIIMNGNYSIIANFATIPSVQYNLTVSSTAGGSVTAPGQGTFTYNAGTIVNLVATPASGHQFVYWTGDVGTIANVNAASTTVIMNASYSIMASFAVILPVQYNLTISSSAGGSVTTPGEGTFKYNAGTVVNLVATPASCYDFVNWAGTVGTIASVNVASTSITMNSNYSITANFEAQEVVHFPDANLEAAIREAIGKPAGPICPSDLEGLIHLSADGKNIVDLTGLEHCTSLTSLSFNWNQVSDISPLANLISLTSLCFHYNQVSNISPLTNLIQLTELYLWGNQISDISPLSNLTNLRRLDLRYIDTSDMSALANLYRLTSLRIEYDQVSDISPLANLTNLTSLSIESNQISDISPLANLTNLTSLNVEFNSVGDISPLVNLTSLTTLNFHANEISDIWPLANLTSVTSLNLEDNQISNISPLANLIGLMELYLQGNQISDISPLTDLTSLTRLRLNGNQIGDILALTNLTNLTWLQLRDNQVTDISPLASLTNLTLLMLEWNQISDISPLSNLTGLTTVYLQSNQISDIEPLVDNPGLSYGDKVYLSNNPLSETSVNTYIPQLEARGVTVYYW